MDKFEELKQIFKGILADLGLSEEQVSSIMALVRTPQEMTKIVDHIEQNPKINYEELFQKVLDSIDFDVVIDK